MKTTLIRVTVKPDHAEHNRELIRAVYAELERTQPDGIHYATFELDDGLSLIHLYSQEHDDAAGLHELAAFRAYLEGTGERFTESPTFSELDEIGSYRVFDSNDATGREPATASLIPEH